MPFAVDLGLIRRHVPGFLSTPAASEEPGSSGAPGMISGHPERLTWRGDDILMSMTNGRLITVVAAPDKMLRRAAEILQRDDIGAEPAETR